MSSPKVRLEEFYPQSLQLEGWYCCRRFHKDAGNSKTSLFFFWKNQRQKVYSISVY